jgi:hypothetical protein
VAEDRSAATERTYTLNSVSFPESAWKRDRDQVDELTLSVHGDGFYGDFSLRWVQIQGKTTPLFRAFADSWRAALPVLALLEQFNEADPSPEEVIAVLEAEGWKPSVYHGKEGSGSWASRQ